jgi:hypothetical protein
LRQRSKTGDRPRTSSAVPGWLTWSLVVLGITAFLAAIAIRLGRAEAPQTGLWVAEDLTWPASFVFFVLVGGLIAARRPGNPLGWGFLGIGLSQVLSTAAFEYGVWAFDQPSLPLDKLAAWAAAWTWIPGIALFPFLVLLFPDGHLPSPKWRWIARATVVNAAVGTGAAMTLFRLPTERLLDAGLFDAGAPGADIAVRTQIVVFQLALLFIAVSMVGFIARFRRSRGVERQQLKWVAFVVFLGLVNVLVFELGADLLGIENLAIDIYSATLGGPGMLALAAGFAILRYRLFDIDVVINRTLVYLLLTGALALVYVVAVVLLQGLVPGSRDSQLAVAASTLAVAAVFRPLRLRIQRFVDRSFYRAKYDAERTLEAFNVRLRDELDLDSLLSELRTTVMETIQPRHVSVWLAEGSVSPEVRNRHHTADKT